MWKAQPQFFHPSMCSSGESPELSRTLQSSPELFRALQSSPELSRALQSSPELARTRQSSPELSRALQSSQIGKWWFGLNQMHSFVFVVFHLFWNTNRKVVVWPQPNAHFCDRCVPFVKITNVKVVVWPQPNAHFCDRCVQFVSSGMDHKCESGGLASAKRTLL